jgi:hypothetical protein
VIAENGAVIHFPDSGRTSTLAPSVPEGFVGELRRRGIPFTAGQCLVDADANEAPRLLEVIRTLELPLVLIFNRSRVMTAPQGVSKASGLHVALETLRLSARNTVAVGDAVEWDEPAALRTVRTSLPGSYERVFHDVGMPAFTVRLSLPALASVLAGPRLERAIGVIYRPETERASHYFAARLPQQFDLVVHVDRTRAVEPLERWGRHEVDLPETYPTGV